MPPASFAPTIRKEAGKQALSAPFHQYPKISSYARIEYSAQTLTLGSISLYVRKALPETPPIRSGNFTLCANPHKDLLQEGADYQIGAKEKTPLAKTVRTCRQLLKVEPALWLFVTGSGLEPTNNAAERAIRPAVLWRRVSFGSQSQAGSVFVARMLTVVTSLRSEGRNVLEFMTATIRAARQGTEPPSLLPEPSSSGQSLTPVA